MPPKFGGAPQCPVCRKSVYGLESKRYFDKEYHEECFLCRHCGKKITGDVASVNGDAYHAVCFKRLFHESGGKLGGQPVVKAAGSIDGEIKAAEDRALGAKDALVKAQREAEIAERALASATAKATTARQSLAEARSAAANLDAQAEALRQSRGPGSPRGHTRPISAEVRNPSSPHAVAAPPAAGGAPDKYASQAIKEAKTIAHIRVVFNRMGFNDKEIVALMGGGHAYGRCHPTSSGYAGPWVEDPTKFSTEFCADLLDDKWAEITSESKNLAAGMCPIRGKRQFNNEEGTGKQMMLVADMCLLWDPQFRRYLEEFRDLDTLKREFGTAFKKLTELGFPEDAKATLSDAEVDTIKQSIKGILDKPGFDDGSIVPILIRLAWHSAGTFDKASGTGGSNGAGMRFEPESTDPENAGLSQARDFLEPIHKAHPNISVSDLWILAGYVAIAESGGPVIPFRSGRSDRDATGAIANGRLPGADKGHADTQKQSTATKLIVLHLHHHFVDYFTAEQAGLERKNEPQVQPKAPELPPSLPREDRHQQLFHRQHHDVEVGKTQEPEHDVIARFERQFLEHPDYKHPDHEVRVFNHVYKSHRITDSASLAKLSNAEELRQHLRSAMRLELSAIPPYLYAMYSLKNKDSDVYKSLLSIAVEEMLHAGLVANLLTAVGGTPSFYDPQAMAVFPFRVPFHKSLSLTLAPMSQAYLENLLCLEQPSADKPQNESFGEFESIGQFYRALQGGFDQLARADPQLFANPHPELQLTHKNYKVVKMNDEASGGMQVVKDLQSARAVIETIIHQDEGTAEGKFAAHVSKLKEIKQNFAQVGEVYPCLENPKTSQFSDDLQVVSNAFNAGYALLMLTLDEMYRDPHDKVGNMHNRMYGIMEGCLRATGQFLCSQPHQPGASTNAGPTFELVVFPQGVDPVAFVQDAMKKAMAVPGFTADAKLAKHLAKIK